MNGNGINPDFASQFLKPKRHFSEVRLLGDQRGPHRRLLAKGSAWAWGRSRLVGSRAPRAAQLRALRLSPAGARAGCRRLLPVQTFLSSSSSRPPHQLLGAQRPASPPLALPRGRRARQRSPRRQPHPALRAGRRREPMAEAGRRSAEPPGGPAGQAVTEAPEPQEPAPPPATALRRLPGDPSPRGRSQSDLSSCSSRGRPLRVHISGSGKAARGRWGPGEGRPGQVAAGRAASPGRRREGSGWGEGRGGRS